MTGTAIRILGPCAALMAVSACASAPPPPMAALGEEPAAAAAPPQSAHGWRNPFFHHAGYTTSATPRALSSRSPIVDLCANARAKAVLDQDLPGLTGRPEFDFFKHMSLQTLKKMSGGKMTDEDVAKVDADLARIGATPTQTASLP